MITHHELAGHVHLASGDSVLAFSSGVGPALQKYFAERTAAAGLVEIDRVLCVLV